MARRNRLQTFVVCLLVAFLVVFPKAGFKVRDVPITFGYLLLGAVSIGAFVWGFSTGRYRYFSVYRLVALVAVFPLVTFAGLLLIANGTHDPGFTISFFVSFALLPLTFCGVLAPYIDECDLEFLLRAIRTAVLLVALYGIFLFLYKALTGNLIEIPYLTINADDVGQMGNKFNGRPGLWMKLISTYNNGNLYGVAILLMLPLCEAGHPRRLTSAIIKLSLVLTLSRTAWIGLIFYELARPLFIGRWTIRKLAGSVFGMIAVAVGVFYVGRLLAGNDLMRFLFDPDLGGRAEQLQVLKRVELIPRVSQGEIWEIVYLSVLNTYGAIGLLLFLIAMMTPILRCLIHWRRIVYLDSMGLAMIGYWVVCCSDGQTLYIPVMAFYWFIASLSMSPIARTPAVA